MGVLCLEERLLEMKMDVNRDFFSVKDVLLTRANIIQLFQKKAVVLVDRLDNKRIRTIKEHLIFEGICKRTVEWELKQEKSARKKRYPRVEQKKTNRNRKKFKRIKIIDEEEEEANGVGLGNKDRKWDVELSSKVEPKTLAPCKYEGHADLAHLSPRGISLPKRPHALLEFDEGEAKKKKNDDMIPKTHANSSALLCKVQQEELDTVLFNNIVETNLNGVPPKDVVVSERPRTSSCEQVPVTVLPPLLWLSSQTRFSPVVTEQEVAASLSQVAEPPLDSLPPLIPITPPSASLPDKPLVSVTAPPPHISVCLPPSSSTVSAARPAVNLSFPRLEFPLLPDIKTEPGTSVIQRAAPSVPLVVIPAGKILVSRLNPVTSTCQTVTPADTLPVVDPANGVPSPQNDAPIVPRKPMIRVRDPASLGIVSRRFSEGNLLQTPSSTNLAEASPVDCFNGPQIESSMVYCDVSKVSSVVDSAPHERNQAPSDDRVPTSSIDLLALEANLKSGEFNIDSFSTMSPSFRQCATEVHRVASFLANLWYQLLNLTKNKDTYISSNPDPLLGNELLKECTRLKRYLSDKRPPFKRAMYRLSLWITFERALQFVGSRVRYLRMNHPGSADSFSYQQFLQVYNLVNSENIPQINQPISKGLPKDCNSAANSLLSRDNALPAPLISCETPGASLVPRGHVVGDNESHFGVTTSNVNHGPPNVRYSIQSVTPTSVGFPPCTATTTPGIIGNGFAIGYFVRLVNGQINHPNVSAPGNGGFGNASITTTTTGGYPTSATTSTTVTNNVHHTPSPATANGYNVNPVGFNLANFGTTSATDGGSRSYHVLNNALSGQPSISNNGYPTTTTTSKNAAGTVCSFSVRKAATTSGYVKYPANDSNRNVGSTPVGGYHKNLVSSNESSGKTLATSGSHPSTITSNIGYSGHMPVASNDYHTYSSTNGNGNIGSTAINSNHRYIVASKTSSGNSPSDVFINPGGGGISVPNLATTNGYQSYPAASDNRKIGEPAGTSSSDTHIAALRLAQRYGNMSTATFYSGSTANTRAITNGHHVNPNANSYQGTRTDVSYGNQDGSVRRNSGVFNLMTSERLSNNLLTSTTTNPGNVSQTRSNGPAPVSVQRSAMSHNQANEAARRGNLQFPLTSNNARGNLVRVNTSQTLVPSSVSAPPSVSHSDLRGKVHNNVSKLSVSSLPNATAFSTTSFPIEIASVIPNATDSNSARLIPLVSKKSRGNVATLDGASPAIPKSNGEPGFQSGNNGNHSVPAIFNPSNIGSVNHSRTSSNLFSSADASSTYPTSANNFRASEALAEIAVKQGYHAERPKEKQPVNGDRQRLVLSQSQEMNVNKLAAPPVRTYVGRKRLPAHVLEQRIEELSRKTEGTVDQRHVVIGRQGASIVEPTKRSYNYQKFDKRITASWMRPTKKIVTTGNKVDEVIAELNVGAAQTAAVVTGNNRDTVIRNNTIQEELVPVSIEKCSDCGKQSVGLCGACKRVAYCSNDCMTSHWIRLHNVECQRA